MTVTKTFTAGIFALAAFALPVTAAQASNGQAVEVGYADLDLSSTAGQAIFDRRISKAIESVCGRLEGRPTFDGSVRRCQAETMVAAKRQRDLAVAQYGTKRLAGRETRTIRFAVR